MESETTTLYRPVGPSELALIREVGYTGFPPRLAGQPIFYPVVNLEYASEIARDWNAKDPRTGYRGFVTRFRVLTRFLAKYEPQQVGSSMHVEYWIPAEDLASFNKAIVGAIEIVAEFDGGRES